MKYHIQTLDSRGIILKTFMSELEVHQSIFSRLANCLHVIEAAGGLINPLKQAGRLLLFLCGNGGSATALT